MVTWSIEGEDVVGAHHARDAAEARRCTDTARTPASLRSKISWTMDHPSELRLDELAPGNVTYASVTLNVRNESDEYLDRRSPRRLAPPPPPTSNEADGRSNTTKTPGTPASL